MAAILVSAQQQVVADGQVGKNLPALGTWLIPRRTIWSGACPPTPNAARSNSMRCWNRGLRRWTPGDAALRGRNNPLMVRNSVVFPAPLAPISATISPGLISRQTPCSAAIARN